MADKKTATETVWGWVGVTIGVLLGLVVLFSIAEPLVDMTGNAFIGTIAAFARTLIGSALHLSTLNAATGAFGQAGFGVVLKIGIYALLTVAAIALIRWGMEAITKKPPTTP